MTEPNKLYILWTNADITTSEKMVFMYATNSKTHYWWKDVTVIIWGATAKVAAENALIREKINIAKQAGVFFTACKACTDQLGVTDKLLEQSIECKYWGEGLTELIREKENLITI
jgi:hypothetical protein